jgi:UDP-N-acetylglucosamine diphosphorylase / glucose-1-phosphate thymidylyltransferase / UDP-N-acetylgalactosamine diphosphorylase / glucosamine-1-phosphate N-acetyltransferase / galactosamine-1-phosphate N-acetyltransferase
MDGQRGPVGQCGKDQCGKLAVMPDHTVPGAYALDANSPDVHLPDAEPPAADLAFVAPAALFDLDGWQHRELFVGCTFAWQALRRLPEYLQSVLRPGIRGDVEPGAYIVGDVEIAEGARVEAGAYIRGPALIGAGTEVRQGAYIRGNVLTGTDCVIGHASECKSAVLLDRAKAPHFAYVGDSILGADVNLGAGVRLANLKMVPGTVTVRLADDARVDTGMPKLGAVVGDRTQIGCNAVTSPGTIVGRDCIVYASVSVQGYVPPGSVAAWRPELSIRPRRGETRAAPDAVAPPAY